MAAAAPKLHRALILGGTGEAVALARRLAADARLSVVTSLAGRTRRPTLPPGELRRGGFGGPEGLADYLAGEAIDLVIDATHPYAAAISRHAATACAAAGVPRLRLERPPWKPQDGDRWTLVPDMAAAARAVPALGRRVFLTVGRQELAAFAALSETWFLARAIELPEGPAPLPHCILIQARGPFDEAAEADLLRKHGIDLLVSKNSGGAATYPKIAAARRLNLPVLMVARPPAPPGDSVAGEEEALAWIEARLAQTANS